MLQWIEQWACRRQGLARAGLPLIIVSVALGSVLFGAPVWAALSDSDLASAVRQYRNGTYDEALNRFKNLGDKHPDDARPLYYQALCQVQLGHFEEAEKLYRSVVLLFPQSQAADFARQGLTLIQSIPGVAPTTTATLDRPARPATFMSQPLRSQETQSGSAAQPIQAVPLDPYYSPAANRPPVVPQQVAAPPQALSPEALAMQQQQQAQMQQMMLMSMMGNNGMGQGGNSMNMMLPMLMLQQQNMGNAGVGLPGQPTGSGMDPAIMSQMLMNGMMGSMDFGLNTNTEK